MERFIVIYPSLYSELGGGGGKVGIDKVEKLHEVLQRLKIRKNTENIFHSNNEVPISHFLEYQ